MTSKLPIIAVRLRRIAYKKFHFIAHKNGRSASKEGCQILLRYIEQYERKNGVISLEELLQLEEQLRNKDY